MTFTPFQPPHRSWRRKFADAFRGIADGVIGESSFHVHLPAAVAVACVAVALRVSLIEACLLTLCVGGVLAAELFNSALERFAKAVTTQANEHVRVALNISSGAVLVVSLFAAAVGAMIFMPRLLALLSAA